MLALNVSIQSGFDKSAYLVFNADINFLHFHTACTNEMQMLFVACFVADKIAHDSIGTMRTL